MAGWLFPAGRSQRASAHLMADGRQLALRHADGTVERLDAAAFRVSSRLSSVPRRLALADGRLFETADNDGIDRLLGGHGEHARSSRLARLERFHPRLILMAVAMMAAVFAAVRWGVPAAGDAAAAVVPYAAEAQIGDHVLAFFDDFVFEASKLPAARREAVEALFAELAAASEVPPGRLRLLFRAGGEIGPNAFAVPGGPIVITDEMVVLAPGDEAIAGVLAHEIGHVERRHGMRLLARAAGLGATILLITGDASSMLEETSAMPAMLLHLSYSREFEREADARAVTLLRATGRSPAGLVELFERLDRPCGEDCPDSSWLSSHPATRERIEALRKAVEAVE